MQADARDKLTTRPRDLSCLPTAESWAVRGSTFSLDSNKNFGELMKSVLMNLVGWRRFRYSLSKIALILSIFASIATIVSIVLNFQVKKEVRAIKGNRNIQATGAGSTNNTGDQNVFK